jgi:hypothetical protein
VEKVNEILDSFNSQLKTNSDFYQFHKESQMEHSEEMSSKAEKIAGLEKQLSQVIKEKADKINEITKLNAAVRKQE